MQQLITEKEILSSIKAFCIDYRCRCAISFYPKLFSMKNVTVYAFLFVVLINVRLSAQGPPIFTDTPIMLGLDGGGIRTFGHFISKQNSSAYIQPITVPYNITSKWQIGANAPFVNMASEGAESRFGFGDLKLFTKFQIHQKDSKGKTFRTLIKLSESFPTGNTSKNPALGSGAYQTAIGLVSGYITTKYGIYGEIAYNMTSNGLADNFIYNLAFGYPLLPQKYPPQQLNLFLELNGNLITDNGSNSIFVSPGIQYIAGSRVLFETGIQLPILENVPDTQKTSFMCRFGVRVLIF